MKKDDLILIIFVTLLAVFTIGFVFGKLVFFKRGQIAALTNNIQYELVVHSDSTRTWEKK